MLVDYSDSGVQIEIDAAESAQCVQFLDDPKFCRTARTGKNGIAVCKSVLNSYRPRQDRCRH
jgi:hypothetical protein